MYVGRGNLVSTARGTMRLVARLGKSRHETKKVEEGVEVCADRGKGSEQSFGPSSGAFAQHRTRGAIAHLGAYWGGCGG